MLDSGYSLLPLLRSGQMLQICCSLLFPLSAFRYSCCHCRPLTSYPHHPTHTYIYTFTLISKQHALVGQKYAAVCAGTKQLCRASKHVGRTVLRGRLRILKNVCGRHMYGRTHAKNHTWPLLLNSQSSSHTHSSSRAASLLTPFHLAHTPAGGFS